jgi:hypothetical protein
MTGFARRPVEGDRFPQEGAGYRGLSTDAPEIHEYDGARHREADVHEDDLERDRALLTARWERHGFHLKAPAARRRHNYRRRRPPARTNLESTSAGCVAGPARPLTLRTGWPRPRLPQLAASYGRNRSDATRRRPQSGS